MHSAPASATTHGSAIFDGETGSLVSSFGAITSPALIVASPDCPVRIKVDVAATAAASPHTLNFSPAGAAKTAESDGAAMESKPPTAPRMVVLPDEDMLAKIIGEIVAKKRTPGFEGGRRGGTHGAEGHGGAHGGGHGAVAQRRGSLINPVTGAATATATTPRKIRHMATTLSIDLRHHTDYRRSVDRLIARDLTDDGIEEAGRGLQPINEAGH